MKLSRRGMLAITSAIAMAPAAAAQTAAQPAANPNPSDPLTKARDENRQDAEKLTKFEIPMSTEPSFVFRP